jgi:hypothetical protein
MHYRIRMGVPDFQFFYNDLASRAQKNALDKDETKLFKLLTKAISFLSVNPRHNSLNTHEIDVLSQRYSKTIGRKIKVWQSYLENNRPAAGRLYWIYGPGQEEITLIGLEPHPEDRKKMGYERVRLSLRPED